MSKTATFVHAIGTITRNSVIIYSAKRFFFLRQAYFNVVSKVKGASGMQFIAHCRKIFITPFFRQCSACGGRICDQSVQLYIISDDIDAIALRHQYWGMLFKNFLSLGTYRGLVSPHVGRPWRNSLCASHSLHLSLFHTMLRQLVPVLVIYVQFNNVSVVILCFATNNLATFRPVLMNCRHQSNLGKQFYVTFIISEIF